MTMVRVAAVQHDIVWEDRDATLATLTPVVAEAAGAGARLVLLPETFATGFTMRTDLVAEPVEGPTAQWLGDQARAHDIWIGGSVPERAAGDELPHNVFVLAGPAGERHRYAKRHPFTYGREHESYAAGDATLTVDVDGLRLSPAVCYDLRFADQFWAQAPETDCYAVVTNWPAKRHAQYRALVVARAIENQAYVVGVNRAGTAGDGTEHLGGTLVVDPVGEVIAEAGADEEVVLVDVDPELVSATRARFPFLGDRR
jgi:predicted amidohydrolase